MKKSYQHIILSSLVSMALITSSCEKIIEINPPLNEVTTPIVFSSDRLAANALAGIYTGLSLATTQNVSLTLNSSLQADDLIYLGAVAGNRELYDNSYTTASAVQNGPFSDWYTIIYRANAVIEGLSNYSGTSEQVKKQYTAEAKVIRAYCYFNLLNTFGAVPLVLTTDPAISAMLPRETTSNIYLQIIKDLLEAKSDLLPDYSASGNTRLGVNRFVAAALLARVSLFTGDYAAAERNASEVIASNLYSLIPAANMGTGVWTKNNSESIWQMSSPLNANNQYTVEAGTFIPASGGPQFELRPSFLDLFSATDLRRQRWMTTVNIVGGTKVLPFKYKYRTNDAAVAAGVAEAQTVLRLAEQYLIRAEARARLGTNLSGALADLNAVRSRAQTAISISTDQSTLIDEILLETRKEFFCEQGFRWFNLKRLGQADALLTILKPSFRPEAKLLPIPNSAISANPNLRQNEGY